MSYAGKRILVTGGAGAIGSNLVKHLSKNDCEIVVIDNLDSGYRENIEGIERVEFLEASILDDGVMEKAFSKGADVVFHLAALFANQNSVEHPVEDLKTNGLGTLKVLQHAQKAGCERFVYSSSSCVYGNQSGKLNEEKIVGKFDTPYAITKLLGEHYVNFFHEYHGINAVILRYFNTYGPGERAGKYRNVIPNFLKLALEGNHLTITGTGNETRDFTFVGDTIEATYLAGIEKKAIGETINIGSGEETKIIDLAKKINAITDNRAGVVFKEKRDWDNISRRVADIGKAKKLLGYKPKYSINDGLKLTLDWFRENKIA